MLNLYNHVKLVKVKDHSAADTSAVTSDAIDMAQDGGSDGVMVLTSLGTAAADNTIKLQQSTDDGDTDDYTDIAGSTVTSGTSEDLWIEAYRPQKRYVKAVVTRGTSTTCESIWALLYSGRKNVTNINTGTITGVFLVEPDEAEA